MLLKGNRLAISVYLAPLGYFLRWNFNAENKRTRCLMNFEQKLYPMMEIQAMGFEYFAVWHKECHAPTVR